MFSVGNALMADDGVAEAVLFELDKRGVPEGVRLFNVAGDPLRVAQDAPDFETSIVIDTANMKLEPGTVRVFRADDAEFPFSATSVSDHGIGLGHAIKMLRSMGISDRLHLICVQPYSIEPKAELSTEMQKQVGKIADIVIDTINQHL